MKKKLEKELRRRLGKISFGHQKHGDVSADEIGFELTEPCASCPFRADIEPYYFQLMDRDLLALSEGRAAFSCHETDPRSDFNGKFRPGGVQHCAGAAIFVENCGHWNSLMTKAFMERRWDNLNMSKRVPVFTSLLDLLRRYTSAIRAGRRNKYLPATSFDEVYRREAGK